MRQVTLNVSEAVYDQVMFFLKTIDKNDLSIEENVYLSVSEKQVIVDEARVSGLSALNVQDIKNRTLQKYGSV
jgi:hypothetical protein